MWKYFLALCFDSMFYFLVLLADIRLSILARENCRKHVSMCSYLPSFNNPLQPVIESKVQHVRLAGMFSHTETITWCSRALTVNEDKQGPKHEQDAELHLVYADASQVLHLG